MKVNDLIEIVGVDEEFPSFDASDYWTQISIPETITIPEEKPDIEQIVKITAKVDIISQRIVKTPISCAPNLAGEYLTGKKLIIEAFLNQKVFYVADLAQQSVHAAHFKVPFSTFILIPCETDMKTKFRIDSYIEDVFVKEADKRNIFKNVTLCLHAVSTDCQCC